jgi:hypothetical protein
MAVIGIEPDADMRRQAEIRMASLPNVRKVQLLSMTFLLRCEFSDLRGEINAITCTQL